MRKSLLLLGAFFVFAIAVSAGDNPERTRGIQDPATTPDPRRVIWMSTLEGFIATQDSHSGISLDTLNREDCEKALKRRDAEPVADNRNAPVLAYGTAYYELSPGMSAEDALAIFEMHHLQKQNWVKQGNILEWWNWKWKAPQDNQRYGVLSVSLDVELRDDKVKRVMFDLGSSEGSLHCVSGSLE